MKKLTISAGTLLGFSLLVAGCAMVRALVRVIRQDLLNDPQIGRRVDVPGVILASRDPLYLIAERSTLAMLFFAAGAFLVYFSPKSLETCCSKMPSRSLVDTPNEVPSPENHAPKSH